MKTDHICDECKKNNASVFYKQTINGKTTEMHLCEECAEKAGLTSGFEASFKSPFDDIFSHISSAFPLSGQKADPLKLPVFRAVIALVFHVIPHAVADFQKFVAAPVRIVQAVPFAAQLDPPEIILKVVILVGKIVVRFVYIGPLGRREGHGMIRLAHLK